MFQKDDPLQGPTLKPTLTEPSSGVQKPIIQEPIIHEPGISETSSAETTGLGSSQYVWASPFDQPPRPFAWADAPAPFPTTLTPVPRAPSFIHEASENLARAHMAPLLALEPSLRAEAYADFMAQFPQQEFDVAPWYQSGTVDEEALRQAAESHYFSEQNRAEAEFEAIWQPQWAAALETHRENQPFILVEDEEGFQEESLYPHEFPVFDRLVVQGYLRRKQAFIDSLDREDAAYIALGLEPPPDVNADGSPRRIWQPTPEEEDDILVDVNATMRGADWRENRAWEQVTEFTPEFLDWLDHVVPENQPGPNLHIPAPKPEVLVEASDDDIVNALRKEFPLETPSLPLASANLLEHSEPSETEPVSEPQALDQETPLLEIEQEFPSDDREREERLDPSESDGDTLSLADWIDPDDETADPSFWSDDFTGDSPEGSQTEDDDRANINQDQETSPTTEDQARADAEASLKMTKLLQLEEELEELEKSYERYRSKYGPSSHVTHTPKEEASWQASIEKKREERNQHLPANKHESEVLSIIVQGSLLGVAASAIGGPRVKGLKRAAKAIQNTFRKAFGRKPLGAVENAAKTLKPNGKTIGTGSGKHNQIRTVPLREFEKIKAELLEGTTKKGTYGKGDGTWYELPDGSGRIGIRFSTKHGETIDIDIKKIFKDGLKIHQFK